MFVDEKLFETMWLLMWWFLVVSIRKGFEIASKHIPDVSFVSISRMWLKKKNNILFTFRTKKMSVFWPDFFWTSTMFCFDWVQGRSMQKRFIFMWSKKCILFLFLWCLMWNFFLSLFTFLHSSTFEPLKENCHFLVLLSISNLKHDWLRALNLRKMLIKTCLILHSIVTGRKRMNDEWIQSNENLHFFHHLEFDFVQGPKTDLRQFLLEYTFSTTTTKLIFKAVWTSFSVSSLRIGRKFSMLFRDCVKTWSFEEKTGFNSSPVHLLPKTNICSILFIEKKTIFLPNSSKFKYFRFWVKLINIFLHRMKKITNLSFNPSLNSEKKYSSFVWIQNCHPTHSIIFKNAWQ